MKAVSRGHWFVWLALFALCVAPWILSRSSSRIVYMDNWPSGQAKLRAVSVRTLDGVYVFDGEYRAYHENGQLQISGQYQRGVEQGPWHWFDETGRQVARCEYRDGVGEYRAVHAGGEAWWSGRMQRGKRVGEWEERDAEGRIVKRGAYFEGEPDGLWSYIGYDDSSSVDEYQGRWDRGDLLESDGGYIRSPALRLGWGEHLLGVALSLLLLVAPWPLAFVLVAEERLLEALLGASVIACTLWVAVMQLLGITGLLHRPGLVVCCAMLLALGRWRGGWTLLRERLGQLFAREWSAGERAIAAVFFVLFAVSAATHLLEPTVNFDSLAYHLPVLVDWLQSGSLRLQPELGQVANYAFGFELLPLANMIALGGDATATWPNLLALGIIALSVLVAGRRLGLAAIESAACAGLLLLIPEFVRRSNSVQPDVALAAFFGCALVLRTQPRLRLAYWCALALVASSKMSGLGYALLLLAISWRGLPRLWSWRALALALFVGGFWLARNLWLVGNPLGAVEFGPFDGSVGVQELRAGSLARLFSPLEAAHWRILGSALWSVLGWPAIPLVALALISLRRRPIVGVIAFAGAVMLYAVAPYSADNGESGYRLTPWMANNLRFGFSALIALSLLALEGLVQLGRWRRFLWLLPALATSWLVAADVAPRYMLLLVTCIGCAAFLAFDSTRIKVALAGSGLLLAVGLAHAGREIRHAARLELYGNAYEWCERRVAERDPVGIVLSERRYPWVGPRLRRPVLDAAPQSGEPFADWVRRLDEAGIQALIIGGSNSSGAQQWLLAQMRDWIDREDFPFDRVGSFDSQTRDEMLYLRAD